MIDFTQARINMLDCQIRPADVTDHRVLEAFATIPRENFVAAAQRPLAYIDEDLKVQGSGPTRYLMEAMTLSRLVQLAEIGEDDFVLDIGCGTGYSTAILSKLASSVVALESDEELAETATQNLMALDCNNAAVMQGPLEKGYPGEGPYDVIFIGGAVEQLPDSIGDQLKDGGRMVVVEGLGNCGEARVHTKSGGVLTGLTAFNCAVMPLPGFEQVPEFQF